jgi:GAF domain-containing protein
MVPSAQDFSIKLNLITDQDQLTLASVPDVSEQPSCSRDYSMCSHVVAKKSAICALNVQQHPIFKYYENIENLTDSVRTYVGFPIQVNNHHIAVLCCHSSHYVQFQDGHLEFLEGLAAIIGDELKSLLDETTR